MCFPDPFFCMLLFFHSPQMVVASYMVALRH
uniref:Uncharacterized protein n=1 Tax=Rhizophora mucronata TaxID=61149 RepID=A0A2P2LYI2_RHIMU